MKDDVTVLIELQNDPRYDEIDALRKRGWGEYRIARAYRGMRARKRRERATGPSKQSEYRRMQDSRKK